MRGALRSGFVRGVIALGVMLIVARAPAGNGAWSQDDSSGESAVVEDQPPVPDGLDTMDAMIADRLREALARVEATSENAAAWRELGMIYHAHDLFPHATACYQQSLDLQPGVAPVWYALALIDHELGDLESALAKLDEVERLMPRLRLVHWRRGFWLLEANRIDEAERAFARATSISANETPAWIGLAQVHLRRREPADAVRVVYSHVLGGEHEPWGHVILASAFRQQGRFHEAEIDLARGRDAGRHVIDRWWRAIISRATGRAFHWRQAQEMITAGRYEKALAALEPLQQYYPDDPAVLAATGVARAELGQHDEAERLLQRAIEIDPDHAQARTAFSRVLETIASATDDPARRDELFLRALGHADRAIELSPSDRNAHRRRAASLFGLERAGDAIEALQRAVALDPADASIVIMLGIHLRERDRIEEAIAAFEQAVERDPANPEARVALVSSCIAVGDVARAREALAEAEYVLADDERLPGLRQAIEAMEITRR